MAKTAIPSIECWGNGKGYEIVWEKQCLIKDPYPKPFKRG